MLALSRKKGQSIIIDGGIEITIVDIDGDKVKLGINAPKNISIYREEIYKEVQLDLQNASKINPKSLINLWKKQK